MKKKKDKQNLKRIAAATIAVLIALIMLLGLLQPLFASTLPAGQPPAITIDGRVGFNRMHRMFGYTPFHIQLANEGGDFEGRLRIMVDVSQTQAERNFVSYAADVFVAAGDTKAVDMVIPLTSSRRTYRVVLLDTRDQIVASRTLFASAVEQQFVMAGMLTDNRQAAARLRWLQVDTWGSGWGAAAILNERLIFLDEDIIPTDPRALSGFNLLIIDDFDIARLSGAQIDAIYEWVNSGGTLVLSEFVEPGFLQRLDDFEGIQASRMRRLTSAVALPFDKAELTHVMPLGSGTVIVHEFSITSEQFMAFEGADAFLSDIYRSAINIDFGTGVNRHSILQLTANLPSFSDTRLVFSFAFVGIYALAIGVVLYLVLKKRDRRELAVFVIPAAAVLVTAVVSVIGFGSGYQEPIAHAVTRLEFEGGSAHATAASAVGIYWPTSGDITVTAANGMPINFELTPQMNWTPMPTINLPISRRTERNEAEIVMLGDGGRSEITFFGRPSWSGGHFSQDLDLELTGSLHGEFVFEGDVLVGSIRNDTGFDLQDVIIGIGTTFERFDILANGDMLEIRETIGTQSPHFSSWQIVDTVFPFQGLGHSLTPEEGRDLQFRRDVLTAMMGGGGIGRMPVFSSQATAVSPNFVVRVPSPAIDIDDDTMYAASEEEREAIARRVAPPYLIYEEIERPERPTRMLTRHEMGAPVNIRVMAYSFNDATDMALTVNGQRPKAIHTNFLMTNFPMHLEGSRSFDLPMGLVSPSAIVTDVNIDFDTFSNGFSVQDAGFVEFIYNFGTSRIDYLAVEQDSFNIEPMILNHATGEWEWLGNVNADDHIYGGEMRLRVDFTTFSWITQPRVHVRGGN